MALVPPISYEFYKNQKFFPSLDGLRAIAVTLVLAVHFGGPMGTIIMGRLGVQIFFVLSGFLITTLLLREHEKNGSIDFRIFYVRRVFRIMPVYYAVLGLVVWQGWHLQDSWPALKEVLPYYLTFFNEYPSRVAAWRISWSLGIEWKFYLVWPILAFAAVQSAIARTVVAVILLAILFGLRDSSYLFRAYIPLMYGATLAMLMHSRHGFRIVAPLTRPLVSAFVFLTFVVFQCLGGRLLGRTGIAGMEYLYSFIVALLIPAILGSGWPRALLSSKPFLFVGRRSYSLYLIEPFAQNAVFGIAPWNSDSVTNFIEVMIVGLMMADFLYRFVESPFIALGHRLSKRWTAAQRQSRAEAVLPLPPADPIK